MPHDTVNKGHCLLLVFALPLWTRTAIDAAAQTDTVTVYRLGHTVSSVMVQPDQRIVVASHGSELFVLDGNNGVIGRRPGGVIRLHPNGSLDDSFRFEGSAVTFIQMHPDGRFLVKASFRNAEAGTGIPHLAPSSTSERSR